MADSQGRVRGNDELMYATTTDPTADPQDPTNYDLVGLLVNNDLESTREQIRAADKAASGFTGVLLGNGDYNVSVTFNRKGAADTGQTTLRDAHFADPATKVYFLITTNTVDDEGVYGEGYVADYGQPSPVNDYIQGTATLAGDGSPTFFTVTT